MVTYSFANHAVSIICQQIVGVPAGESIPYSQVGVTFVVISSSGLLDLIGNSSLLTDALRMVITMFKVSLARIIMVNGDGSKPIKNTEVPRIHSFVFQKSGKCLETMGDII